MAEGDNSERRLAAILAADVVGYSKMMAADEAGTLALLKRHRETVFNPAVAAHRGRVVKLIGDGTLVEFTSVVDAVRCAIAIQRACVAEREAKGGIQLRIGINLGDVIIDGDDIYGDGVNVAARLEPLAEPGGICIASIVNESVGSRIDDVFRDGGEVSVKNISRPIRIWRWHPGGGQASPAVAEPSKAPAPEQPSVAVLPFNNMSGDPEQEYFSDGISEDIITDLSKIVGLLVIARNSSFAYKGQSVDIRKVGRELGAKAVLEGSIRSAGNRMRVNAQLIDAESGAHLWAERYDRELTDIFAVQDEVTGHIVGALKVKLSPDEAKRIAEPPTHDIGAHDHYLRGRALLLGTRFDRATFEAMVSHFERAIALDPQFAEPYAALAMAHLHDFQNRFSGRADALEVANRFAADAVRIGPTVPEVRYTAAVTAFWNRDLKRARDEAEAALALNPNFAMAYSTRGLAAIYDRRPLEAIEDIDRAIRLDPGFTHQYIHFLGSAYLVAGKYEAAVAAFRERIRLKPDTDLSRSFLAASLGHLGETDEARRVWAELKRISPGYSFEAHLKRLPFTDPVDADHIRAGAAKANLPD